MFRVRPDRFDWNSAETFTEGNRRTDSRHSKRRRKTNAFLANILIPPPRLLLLDEPSLGLSPPLVKEAFAKLTEINRAFGTTMVIVEQKVREVLKICQTAYLLKMGRVAYAGASSELLDGDRIREIFL